MVDPTHKVSTGISGALRAFATALDGLVRNPSIPQAWQDDSAPAESQPEEISHGHDALPDPATFAQDDAQADLTWLQGDDQAGAWEALEASLDKKTPQEDQSK
ncbi:hypothetical protein [Magnetococcus sp. PR-3]|uniref:hypothetical protein n=1 Tax=Magnetococcus sp. PR-3 TaxID=3120355 RepID=UPI002FCE56AC